MTTRNWTGLLLGIIAAVTLPSCGNDSDPGNIDSGDGGLKSGWTTDLIDQLKNACLQSSSGLGAKADAYCSCTANRIASKYSVEQLSSGGGFDAGPIKAACIQVTGIQLNQRSADEAADAAKGPEATN